MAPHQSLGNSKFHLAYYPTPCNNQWHICNLCQKNLSLRGLKSYMCKHSQPDSNHFVILIGKNDQQCLIFGRDCHSFASLRSHLRAYLSLMIVDTEHKRWLCLRSSWQPTHTHTHTLITTYTHLHSQTHMQTLKHTNTHTQTHLHSPSRSLSLSLSHTHTHSSIHRHIKSVILW